ncbi:hypothetical protein [Sphingosinicella humi]|uniref:Uncharacterized protein n=1 Tax=Allosphingosinicella humi TaxID=2068657 RepID=A0A2U2J4V1_9SPHN|nr:hypothetical protein [Sphingosinicella humi]PWG03358.1 hypothetical protein DF286_11125 [Sphingosinicella humi]
MTREEALQRVLYVWLGVAPLLGLLILAQAVAGKYGDDASSAWSWYLALIVPPVSILVTAALVDPKASWRNAAAHAFKYRLAFWGSGALLFIAFTLLLAEPGMEAAPYQLFEQSAILLTVLQGIVLAAIGAVVFDRR